MGIDDNARTPPRATPPTKRPPIDRIGYNDGDDRCPSENLEWEVQCARPTGHKGDHAYVVRTLRALVTDGVARGWPDVEATLTEAADEIERLRAEVLELRSGRLGLAMAAFTKYAPKESTADD